MKYKNYWILLNFSLVLTNLTCFAEDRATQEEISAVEEIPASEEGDDVDFDLDDLNTEDVTALMEQIKVIEEKPHDTTWTQKLEFLKVFMQMQVNNVWDEFKTDPVIYSAFTASIIASIIVLIYAVKSFNNSTNNPSAKIAK